MEIRSLSPELFREAFPTPLSVYGSTAFAALNAHKAEAVRYLGGFDSKGKPRMGIIAGLRNGGWHVPFSAPFGEISTRGEQSLAYIYEFISELTHYLDGAPLRITLPPSLYQSPTATRIHGILANYAESAVYDYNYHYPLALADSYMESLRGTGRRNLRRALGAGFTFERTADIERVYSIVHRHHTGKGYPVRMSLSDIEATAKVIDTDFFVLSLSSTDVAAAMIQRVSPGVTQLIYWGDLPGHEQLRPMNMMACRICEFYRSEGFDTFDLGPASSDGIPDWGLCHFKESLGAELTLKPTFTFTD